MSVGRERYLQKSENQAHNGEKTKKSKPEDKKSGQGSMTN